MSIADLQESLGETLVERDAEINAILLGLVAREHVLLVGPPGTAKSMLCRSVAAGIVGMRSCERLLAPSTPPESLFGPISLSALREDRYEHMGDGSITDAELVFLDEVFRGSDAIHATMLQFLGPERQALIGTQQVRVPLISAVGASNSWSDSADQQAFLDRWLIRRTVRPLSPQGRDRLLFTQLAAVKQCCTLTELDDTQRAASAMPFSSEAKVAYLQILEVLAGEGIQVSDRRAHHSLKVARAAAAIDGASEVKPLHLECLIDVLWDEPVEQPEKADAVITKIVNPIGTKLKSLEREVTEIMSAKYDDTDAQMEGVKKLQAAEGEAAELTSHSGNGRATKVLQYIRTERVRLQCLAMGLDPEKHAPLMMEED